MQFYYFHIFTLNGKDSILMLIYNLVCLLLQSKLPDGDVKVSPQNLTLHLRPGTLLR